MEQSSEETNNQPSNLDKSLFYCTRNVLTMFKRAHNWSLS